MKKSRTYEEITGYLIYLVSNTRNGIAYGVVTLTQKTNAAVQQDFKAAKRILRYIKGIPSLGINFSRGNFKLKTYADASFANPTLGYRSASGYLVSLGGGSIFYGSICKESLPRTHVKRNYWP